MSTFFHRALGNRGCSRVFESIGAILVILLGVFSSQQVRAQTASEYQIKAAFILNFAKFVEWPNGPFENGNMVVGIVGNDPFGGAIDQIVNGSRANGRTVVVRRLRRSDNLRGCNILFISSSENKNLGPILDGLKGSSVLTVGEMSEFTRRGGMIRLKIQDNKVRFEVNSTAAGQAGLRVSSKLMALSKGAN